MSSKRENSCDSAEADRATNNQRGDEEKHALCAVCGISADFVVGLVDGDDHCDGRRCVLGAVERCAIAVEILVYLLSFHSVLHSHLGQSFQAGGHR